MSFSHLRADERGQGLVEYALIIFLVATVIVGALSLLGADIEKFFEPVIDAI